MKKSNWSEWRQPFFSRNLSLYPLFGTTTFGADTRCRSIHPDRDAADDAGPMHQGDKACCMACHQSGQDGHPDLVITDEERAANRLYNPEDAWHTLAAENPTSHDAGPAPLTRKERRAEARRRTSVPVTPTDPDEIRRLVDGGHATVMGH